MIRTIWAGESDPSTNGALADWCAMHIGPDMARGFETPYVTMGVLEDDRLIAVVVYNNWNPEAGVIELHGAGVSPRWLTRPVLKAMFVYPFERAQCQMVVMRVAESNYRLLRILTAYGFDHVLIPRLRGRNEGERIFTLTDDAWRSNKFNRKG